MPRDEVQSDWWLKHGGVALYETYYALWSFIKWAGYRYPGQCGDSSDWCIRYSCTLLFQILGETKKIELAGVLNNHVIVKYNNYNNWLIVKQLLMAYMKLEWLGKQRQIKGKYVCVQTNGEFEIIKFEMYVIRDTSYALFHIRLLLFWQLGQVRSHKSLLNETQVDFKSSPDCAGYPVLILIVILKIKASVAGQFLSSLGENYGALAHQHHQKTTLWWMGKWRRLRRNSIQRKAQNLPCDPIPFLEGRS